MSNREIDFGCGCVACVRACEAVCGRVRDDGSSGAGPKNWKFVGVAPCPAVPAAPPDAPDVEKTSSVFPNLIASGYSAQRAVCFLGVFIPKNLHNFGFVCRPAGPDPPAWLVVFVASTPRLRSSHGLLNLVQPCENLLNLAKCVPGVFWGVSGAFW